MGRLLCAAGKVGEVRSIRRRAFSADASAPLSATDRVGPLCDCRKASVRTGSARADWGYPAHGTRYTDAAQDPPGADCVEHNPGPLVLPARRRIGWCWLAGQRGSRRKGRHGSFEGATQCADRRWARARRRGRARLLAGVDHARGRHLVLLRQRLRTQPTQMDSRHPHAGPDTPAGGRVHGYTGVSVPHLGVRTTRSGVPPRRRRDPRRLHRRRCRAVGSAVPFVATPTSTQADAAHRPRNPPLGRPRANRARQSTCRLPADGRLHPFAGRRPHTLPVPPLSGPKSATTVDWSAAFSDAEAHARADSRARYNHRLQIEAVFRRNRVVRRYVELNAAPGAKEERACTDARRSRGRRTDAN